MKILISILIICLLSCGQKSSHKSIQRAEGWDAFTLDYEKAGCVESYFRDVNSSISIHSVQGACNCIIDYMSYKYSYETISSIQDIVITQETSKISECKAANHVSP